MSSNPEMRPGRGKSMKTLEALKAQKRERITFSRRAGLVFPVTRTRRYMRKYMTLGQRIRLLAAVTLAAVLEYLVADLLNLAGLVAKDLGHRRISPRHIILLVNEDSEFYNLLHGVTIPDGGVAPFIRENLTN